MHDCMPWLHGTAPVYAYVVMSHDPTLRIRPARANFSPPFQFPVAYLAPASPCARRPIRPSPSLHGHIQPMLPALTSLPHRSCARSPCEVGTGEAADGKIETSLSFLQRTITASYFRNTGRALLPWEASAELSRKLEVEDARTINHHSASFSQK